MADKIITLQLGGKSVECVEVPISESTEKWSELKLEDGTTIRVKLNVVLIARSEEFDTDGNPVYVVRSQPVIAVVDVPAKLRKKTN